jgi:hypothetical protein
MLLISKVQGVTQVRSQAVCRGVPINGLCQVMKIWSQRNCLIFEDCGVCQSVTGHNRGTKSEQSLCDATSEIVAKLQPYLQVVQRSNLNY